MYLLKDKKASQEKHYIQLFVIFTEIFNKIIMAKQHFKEPQFHWQASLLKLELKLQSFHW